MLQKTVAENWENKKILTVEFSGIVNLGVSYPMFSYTSYTCYKQRQPCGGFSTMKFFKIYLWVFFFLACVLTKIS